MLLPSAGIAYDTALVGSSAAAFCAPVVFAADFVGCCCGAGPWRNVPFLVLVLIPPLLKSIGHGAAQARPSAQNSPVYATQAPFCLCFTGVWSGSVLY